MWPLLWEPHWTAHLPFQDYYHPPLLKAFPHHFCMLWSPLRTHKAYWPHLASKKHWGSELPCLVATLPRAALRSLLCRLGWLGPRGWQGLDPSKGTFFQNILLHIREKARTHWMVLGVCWVSTLENKQIRVGKEPLGQHSPENREVQKTSLRNE